MIDPRIEFNEGNLIPHYQNKHKLYDRFLPHLAKYLEGTIIDVGANCGALAVEMGSANPALDFICIEPEQKHIDLLEKNIKIITNKVQVYKSKIGTEHTALDLVLNLAKVDEIGLLKVDVDGYDWDVIDSYSFAKKPVIYIEEDFKEAWQTPEYFRMNKYLYGLGYTNFWMFDNFGCFIGFTNSLDEIGNINAYIDRMKRGQSDMTLWYMDILMCQNEDMERLSKAVVDYIIDGS